MLAQAMGQTNNLNVPFEGLGLDYCLTNIPKKNGYALIQSVDYFYPLIEDPFQMGKITCANVLSDVYASGVTTIISLQMVLGVCYKIEDPDIREEVYKQLIAGFKEMAEEADASVDHLVRFPNEWVVLGGVATGLQSPRLISTLRNDQASIGDVLVLTKPLGTQVAANLHQWMVNDNDQWKSIEIYIDRLEVKRAYERAISSMTRLNKNAALLMSKYNASAVTDVTGFGLLGHADNLVKRQQKKGLQFVIKMLPIIRKMKFINDLVNNRFKLLEGLSAETSGGLLIALPVQNAKQFCDELKSMDNRRAYIIGYVDGDPENQNDENSVSIVKDADVLEVPEKLDQMFV